jgi:hypothetical protein
MRFFVHTSTYATTPKFLQTGHDESDMFFDFQLPSLSGQSSMADRFSFLFSLNSSYQRLTVQIAQLLMN